MSSAYVAQRSRDLNKLAMMSMAPFQLYVWPQHLLMLGRAYASAQHRHHAAQIAFGLDGPAIFESPHTGVHRADMLLISPNTPHAHPAFGPLAFLYLWPESAEWVNFPGQKNGGVVPLPFNLQLRSIARSAAGGDAAAAQLLVDQFDWKVRKQCSKRRCFSLSRRRSDQPESRRADHPGGCGQGDAPISQPVCTPLQRSNRLAAATLCFMVPPPRRDGGGDARCKLDRSGPHCRVRGLRTSVANFPRNVRRHTVFAV
jgi:hypothetical protein